jgi:hypothetical protein
MITDSDSIHSMSISNNPPVSRKTPIQREIARTLHEKSKKKEELEGMIDVHVNKHGRLAELLTTLRDVLNDKEIVFLDTKRWDKKFSHFKDSVWKKHGKFDLNDSKKLKEQIEELEKRQRGLAILLNQIFIFIDKDLLKRNNMLEEYEKLRQYISAFVDETLQDTNAQLLCASLQGNNSVVTTTVTPVETEDGSSNTLVTTTKTTRSNGGGSLGTTLVGGSAYPRYIMTNLFALNRDPSTNPSTLFQHKKKRRNNKNSASNSNNNRSTIASLEDVKIGTGKRRISSASSSLSAPFSFGNTNPSFENNQDMDEASAVITKRGRKRKTSRVTQNDMKLYEEEMMKVNSNNHNNQDDTITADLDDSDRSQMI